MSPIDPPPNNEHDFIWISFLQWKVAKGNNCTQKFVRDAQKQRKAEKFVIVEWFSESNCQKEQGRNQERMMNKKMISDKHRHIIMVLFTRCASVLSTAQHSLNCSQTWWSCVVAVRGRWPSLQESSPTFWTRNPAGKGTPEGDKGETR